MNPLVLGIGSPFGTDRLGWLAIDALASAGLERTWPGLRLLKIDRPGSRLLTLLDGADQALLIDALDGPGAPGSLRRTEPAELAVDGAGLSGHRFGVAEALALARALGDLPPRLVLYAIRAGCGPWPEPLELTAASRQRLLRAVRAELGASGVPHPAVAAVLGPESAR
jgi:hydrogenase maturation protease